MMKPKYLPTAKKIAEETAKIREGWGDAEREQRAHGCTGTRGGAYQKKPWTAPMYSFSLNRVDGLVADRVD